jgi:hypothetical protein
MSARFKKTAIFMSTMFLMLILGVFTSVIVSADTFYTVRINYYYTDGTPARDAYVATFAENSPVDLTVTNPTIDGFVPMSLRDGESPENLGSDGVGESALTTEFHYDSLDSDHYVNIYYVAGLTHYRALYYKQNLYDDLYTRDNTLPSSLTDRFGPTGSNPTDLEDVQFEGFTNLFHEPDAIAADGSTLFRVYYDRNYYSVKFDLGPHGYGLDPIYAKYQSSYHIVDPKRMGFTFKGWLRTDKDSSTGMYKYSPYNIHPEAETSWVFIDENGNELLDSNNQPIFDENGALTEGHENYDLNDYYKTFNDGTIPAHDTYYKAMWLPGKTSYSVVYWFQNPNGRDLTTDELNNAADIDAARLLISQNYSVVAAKDIENVDSGIYVNLDTTVTKASGGTPFPISDFFSYNLNAQAVDIVNGEEVPRVDSSGYPLDDNNKRIDFPTISKAKREELIGKSKLYVFGEEMSSLQFGGAHEVDPSKTHIEVMGDGTTRINVYYDRKDFTLKFYYARQKLVNGEATGTISLTNSTKNFSKKEYGNNSNYMQAVAAGTWVDDATDDLPHIKDEYLVENGGILTELYTDYSGWRYYYYQVETQYGQPLAGKWLIDAITSVPKKNFAGEESVPGSWAVEFYTRYFETHTTVNNYTIKGIYEKLGDELMFETRQSKTKDNTLKELHYLLSWTNTAKSNSSDAWNYGTNHVLHFKYMNYTELLPREISMMEDDNDNDGNPDGPNALIDAGLYEDIYLMKNDTFTHVNPDAPFVYDSDAGYYGLKHENITDTVDSGGQYDTSSKTINVYANQVPTTMSGYTLVNYREFTGNETDLDPKLKSLLKKGQIIVNEKNAIVDWTGDSSSYRQATIKFFYNRNHYTLKWRNGNRLEEEHTRDVMYGSPFNSVYTHDEGDHLEGEYRYWYNGSPTYFNEDLHDYYNFIGWYYTPYYYRLVDKDTATMPADDVTLYARWDPKIINVSFYPTYNDYYEGINKINGENPVNYGDYISINKIPANVNEDPDELRPDLIPPTEGAMFAGWYYLRDNVPVRFDPETVPITALNYEASLHEGARLRLYAEWATRDAAKYKVTYVEKNNPNNEVADPTTGRAFVWKTKTFNAKGGSELNADHAWTEDGINWWPTIKSHSLVIQANSQGHNQEYEPNTYSFEYIQKQGVYYRVQYLDAATRTPLLDPATIGKDEVYSTHGSVKEDAPFISGYTAEKMSQSMVLAASDASDSNAQRAEELANNVLTFYYNKNDKNFVYEVEYYKQNIDDNDYTHYLTEYMEVTNADDPETQAVEQTYVSLADLYNTRVSQQIESDGFTRVVNGTKVAVSFTGQEPTETSVLDTDPIEITGDKKTTVKIYFDRNEYTYKYQYVDYQAEKVYNKKVEDGEDVTGVWNGVLEEFDNNPSYKVDSTITINVPLDTTYTINGEQVPYTRISNNEVSLTISPTNSQNDDVNFVKVYYKKYYDREINYKLVCQNEDNPYTEVDYDTTKNPKQPLFGGLSMTLQTVDAYNKINDVVFYDFNNAKDSIGEDLHEHKYTFLGWYDNPEGTGNPLVAYDADNPTAWYTLKKSDLGLNESLPEHDVTYYAVVKQEMVKADFEFRLVDEALPSGGEPISQDSAVTANDLVAAEIVRDATIDTDGSYTGSYFAFTTPYQYENGSPLPYHKKVGYTVDILPKTGDNRVYKYEFAEWWEENLKSNNLIRKKNWNLSGDWGVPTTVEDQLDRREDKHVIAVFKRREVDSMPYTINYKFPDRWGVERTYVVKGTLTGDDLDESSENCKITTDGDYRLNDEFIMSKAPYESNHGKRLCWTDTQIEKTSIKGNPNAENNAKKLDRLVATAVADQSTENVHVHYKLTPDDDNYTTIEVPVGADRDINDDMQNIDVNKSDKVQDGEYNGNKFSYWEIRKSRDGDVIAKSYRKAFDFCIMDDYWITPVFAGESTTSEDLDNIVLKHLDYNRNRWTDENGEIASNGLTDLLFTNFEISFNNKDKKIYGADSGYKTGVVFELCAALPSGKTFKEDKDYGFVSDETNLKAKIAYMVDQGISNAPYVYDPASGKSRSIMVKQIPTDNITNRNRCVFGQSYANNYTGSGDDKKYYNSTYVLKATAYLIDDEDNVTLSNSVYTCLNAISQQDLALPGMTVITQSNP